MPLAGSLKPTHAQAARGLCAATILVIGAICFIGCASAPSPPSVTPGTFTDLLTKVEPSMSKHVVAIECPSAGHQATLTRSLDEHMGRGVYITIRQPDGSVDYPPRTVMQRVATDIPVTTTLRVYLRVIPADAPANSDAPFVFAASAEGTVKVPTPP